MVNRKKNNRSKNNAPSRNISRNPRVLSQPGRFGNPSASTYVRTYLRSKAITIELDVDSELYVDQGTQGGRDLQFSVIDFIPESTLEVWDQYRFESITLEAKYNPIDSVTQGGLSNVLQPIDVFTSFDPTGPADAEVEWQSFRSRANVSRVTITPQSASKHLITFVPGALRTSSAADAADQIVFDPRQYYNTLGGASTVRFGKAFVYGQCNTFNSVGNNNFKLDIIATARITLKAPRGT